MNKYVLFIVLSVICGTLWRCGGADDYDKLWRRVGSALCMICILPYTGINLWIPIAYGMMFWGCTSYFGWINHFVKKFWKDIDVEAEYVWNFFAENLVIQSSVVVINHNPLSAFLAVFFAAVSAFVKVLIDNHDENYILEWRKDVVSEFWHGFSNCLFIAINTMV